MKKPKPRKMTDKEFKDRVTEVATMELAEPEKLMWLSFADDGDDGFKGAIIIKAHGITDALMKCNLLQINPGGEVYAVELPPKSEVKAEDMNRLLSKEEIDAKWGLMKVSELPEGTIH